MAANINDKFRKTFNSENPNVTFVSSTRTALATTLSCDSLTGWPTDTAVDLITYKLDTDGETVIPGSQTDWKGIVSGSTVTELTRVAGAADTGNDVNDVVEMTPTGTWGNDLIETLLVSHDQDGTLKDKIVALTNVNGGDTEGVLHTSSSGDVTGGKVVNADLSTTAGELGGTWQSWTPTFTGLSGGTLNYAVYTRIGKTVFFNLTYTMTGANVSGSVTFTLPVTASASNNSVKTVIGHGVGQANSGSAYNFLEVTFGSVAPFTNAVIFAKNAGGSYVTAASLSATVPITWASGGGISVSGSYEAA